MDPGKHERSFVVVWRNKKQHDSKIERYFDHREKLLQANVGFMYGY
jgi:hypothetical protein